jgi:glutathione S-transferase
MQDSSAIIDEFERRFPHRAVVPKTPRQRVVSSLLEFHGDEWLISLAIHYRWNYPENRKFAIAEFAKYGVPLIPGVIARPLIRPIAKKMAAYREILGITPQTVPGFERFAETLFDQLEDHFEHHDFLLGSRPSIADFAMFATPWAHVWRDPGSRHVFNSRPRCLEWFERLNSPSGEEGEFLAHGEVPETLMPILETMYGEHMPYTRELIGKVDAYCTENPEASRVPRSLGYQDFVIGGVTGNRKMTTFSQWMAQRPLAAYEGLSEAGRASVDTLLASLGGLGLEVANPFERRDFQIALARA